MAAESNFANRPAKEKQFQMRYVNFSAHLTCQLIKKKKKKDWFFSSMESSCARSNLNINWVFSCEEQSILEKVIPWNLALGLHWGIGFQRETCRSRYPEWEHTWNRQAQVKTRLWSLTCLNVDPICHCVDAIRPMDPEAVCFLCELGYAI